MGDYFDVFRYVRMRLFILRTARNTDRPSYKSLVGRLAQWWWVTMHQTLKLHSRVVREEKKIFVYYLLQKSVAI